jgi:hypothetical protein
LSQKRDKSSITKPPRKNQNPKKASFLKKAFKLAVYGTVFSGAFLFSDDIIENVAQIEPIRTKMIESQIDGDITKQCLRSSTLRPPGIGDNVDFKPTQEQMLLTEIFNKMRQTPIGQELNSSAKENDVIWCVNNNETDNYGYYMSLFNLASLSSETFGGLESMHNTERQFNRTLRTAYEESAHAWQNNENSALDYSVFLHPVDAMVHSLSSEADARVTTFLALYQHLQSGEKSIWNDNLTDPKNTSVMQTLQKNYDGSLSIEQNHKALYETYRAFFETSYLSASYQKDFLPHLQLGKIRSSSATLSKKFGFIPGQASNYLSSHTFDLRESPFNKIYSGSLQYEMVMKLIKLGEDPLSQVTTPSGFNDYNNIKIEQDGRFEFIMGKRAQGDWTIINSNFTLLPNVQSEYYINEIALKCGYVVISKKSEDGAHSLVHLQKLDDLDTKIEDLRLSHVIPDYSATKQRYISFKNISSVSDIKNQIGLRPH